MVRRDEMGELAQMEKLLKGEKQALQKQVSEREMAAATHINIHIQY